MVFDGGLRIAGLSDPTLKTPLLGGFALNLPPFPLDPGGEYEWRLHVDGKTRSGWTLPFRTMRPEEETAILQALATIEQASDQP